MLEYVSQRSEKMKSFCSQRLLTLSNGLSLFRAVVAPFIACAIMDGQTGRALLLLILAGVSDFLDGYIARLFGEQTMAGQYLDPLADKVLMLSVFSALASIKSFISPWFVWFIFARECIIVGGGVLLLWFVPGVRVAPTLFGKATTVAYLVLAVALLTGLACPLLVYVVSAIAFSSLVHYFYRGAYAALNGRFGGKIGG